MTDTERKHELDERVAIPLDPETALRGLLKVDPDSEPTDKERALDVLRQAHPGDLARMGGKWRGDARRAGASWDEIDAAQNTPPLHRP